MKLLNLFSPRSLLLAAIFIPGFIMSAKFTDPFALPKYFYFYFLTGIAFVFYAVRYFFRKYKSTISITKLDFIILCFYLYQTLQLIFNSHSGIESDNYISLSLIVTIYLILKNNITEENEWLKFKRLFLIIILSIGLLQGLFGIMQLLGLIPTLQSEFAVSGAFGNPGPYATYLILASPYALSVALNRDKKKNGIFWLSLTTFSVIAILLPFTESRTSWIAFFIGNLYVVNARFSLLSKFFKALNSLWTRALFFGLLSGFIVISGIYLYNYKEESASGRLFIWKVTLSMIADKPVFGSGFDSYPAAHNTYQAEYFRTQSYTAEEAELADGVNYAFNEYLQLSAEMGLVGLSILLLIIYHAFSVRNRVADNRDDVQSDTLIVATKGGIIVFLVSALFSYPFHTTPSLVLFYTFLAILSARSKNSLLQVTIRPNHRRIISIISIIILLLFLSNQKKKHDASKEWLHAFHYVRAQNYSMAKDIYQKLYPLLSHNQYFLFNYGAELSLMGEYKKSISILTETEKHLNDSDVYIYKGNSYHAIGKLKEAAECFEKASHIMPVKFYPKYRRVKVLIEMGENKQALELAKEILNMKVKIPSDVITNIKAEMAEFVNTHNQEH